MFSTSGTFIWEWPISVYLGFVPEIPLPLFLVNRVWSWPTIRHLANAEWAVRCLAVNALYVEVVLSGNLKDGEDLRPGAIAGCHVGENYWPSVLCDLLERKT